MTNHSFVDPFQMYISYHLGEAKLKQLPKTSPEMFSKVNDWVKGVYDDEYRVHIYNLAPAKPCVTTGELPTETYRRPT